MADGGADAVVSGVSAADDDDVFVPGIHVFSVRKIGVQQALGIGGKEINGEIDSLGVAAWRVDVSGI